MGSVMDAWTSATIWALSVMEVIIQDAPTDWMSPPKFENMLAIHTARNTGWLSGDNADMGLAAASFGELGPLISPSMPSSS